MSLSRALRGRVSRLQDTPWARQTHTVTSRPCPGTAGGTPGLLPISEDAGDGVPDADIITVVEAARAAGWAPEGELGPGGGLGQTEGSFCPSHVSPAHLMVLQRARVQSPKTWA